MPGLSASWLRRAEQYADKLLVEMQQYRELAEFKGYLVTEMRRALCDAYLEGAIRVIDAQIAESRR